MATQHLTESLQLMDLVAIHYGVQKQEMKCLQVLNFLTTQMMVLMTKANGISTIRENIFENRFMHVSELRRMGVRIDTNGNKAKIFGQCQLNGAELMATDLRASVSLVLAGLVAKNKTIINRIYHLDRGYENIESKLSKCGARIKRL